MSVSQVYLIMNTCLWSIDNDNFENKYGVKIRLYYDIQSTTLDYITILDCDYNVSPVLKKSVFKKHYYLKKGIQMLNVL